MRPAIIVEGEKRMENALEAFTGELATLRTSKATPTLLDTIRVEAYGSHLPIQQLATVTVPEPRLLVVQPWDKSTLGAIERAIRTSELDLTPSNDGAVIRIPIPQLTEERRGKIIKLVHKLAEEARIGIRQVRRDLNAALKDQEKAGTISEDDGRRLLQEVQELTDRQIGVVDEALKRKEAEIKEV